MLKTGLFLAHETCCTDWLYFHSLSLFQKQLMKQPLSTFFWLLWHWEKKEWTTHWLLKFILRSDTQYFRLFSLAKANHMARLDISGSGMYNPPLGQIIKYRVILLLLRAQNLLTQLGTKLWYIHYQINVNFYLILL